MRVALGFRINVRVRVPIDLDQGWDFGSHHGYRFNRKVCTTLQILAGVCFCFLCVCMGGGGVHARVCMCVCTFAMSVLTLLTTKGLYVYINVQTVGLSGDLSLTLSLSQCWSAISNISKQLCSQTKR